MMNSDQTRVTGKTGNEKINVPVKGKLAKTLRENRGKAGLAAGMLAAIGFVSAKDLLAQNQSEVEPMVEVEPVTEEEMVETDGTFLSVDPGDSIHQSVEGQSFSEAFMQAREAVGPGGIFEWNGKYYNTFYAEEFADLSDDQKKEYAANIDNEIQKENSTIVESKSGELVEVEFSPDNVLSITINNPEVIKSMEGLDIDINNDGVADLSMKTNPDQNAEMAGGDDAEAEETNEEDSNEQTSEEHLTAEMEADEESDNTDSDGNAEIDKKEGEGLSLEYDDLPEEEANEPLTDRTSEIDEDDYPDIDSFNEELLQ